MMELFVLAKLCARHSPVPKRCGVRDRKKLRRTAGNVTHNMTFARRNLQSLVGPQNIIAAEHSDVQLAFQHEEELPRLAVEVLYLACAGWHALVKNSKVTPA